MADHSDHDTFDLKPGKKKRKRKRLTSTHDADKPDSSTSVNNSSICSSQLKRNPQSIADVVDASEGRLEKTKKCPINVWWDWENAGVPYDLHPKEVYGRFLKKLGEEGFTGRVKIWIIVAYKDSMTARVESDLYEGVNKENLKIKRIKNFSRPKNSANNQIADIGIKDSIRKWLKKGREPQNTILVTGDNGFKDILKKLLEAGHTTLLAFRKIEDQEATSVRVDKFANVRRNWRVFLSLSLKSISKKMRSAQFEEMKRKAAAELGHKRFLQRYLLRCFF